MFIAKNPTVPPVALSLWATATENTDVLNRWLLVIAATAAMMDARGVSPQATVRAW